MRLLVRAVVVARVEYTDLRDRIEGLRSRAQRAGA
jgi:hypothetical protein